MLLLSLSALLFRSNVLAARVRVRAAHTGSGGVTYSTAHLSRPTHSVVVTFQHLDRASSVTYTLSYLANDVEQGVMGSMTPTGELTDSRDLYFGTCSKGVCTPHYNISGATLLVETTLKTGGTNTKRYVIKI